MCAVVVTGVARSNTWRLRIAAKSSIASGAPLRFWGGGLGVLLALGVWYSTAGASVRMVGAGRGGGPCATAGRIFSARFESSRVLNGFVLLFCFFVQVFVASVDWMAGGGGAVQTSADNGDGGFVELRALCCCSNGAYSQALGMLASPSTSRAASSPCEMADLPIVAL